jgi:uncharacterized protein YlzI (FlbEa/FlbD family)
MAMRCPHGLYLRPQKKQLPFPIIYYILSQNIYIEPPTKGKNMLELIEKITRNVICEFNSDHIIQAESIQEVTEKVIHWKQCMFLILSLCFILGMNGINNITLPNQCRIQ